MFSLSNRQQLLIGITLAALVAATRSHHFASVTHLPDASWAVFFLAGFYLRQWWVFPALLAEAAFSDFAAITFGGVSSFCVSPAYGFLLPAYGALYLAGRWYAERHRFGWHTLVPFTGSVFSGVLICELLSSGGFYFFSGRFAETTLVEFGARLARYLPHSMESVAFYMAVAAIVHVAFTLVAAKSAHENLEA